MNSGKRVIDASRGLPPRQYVQRQPINVTVQPNTNMIYRDQYVPKPVVNVQQPVVEKPKVEQPSQQDKYVDIDMMGFDISGNNLNEIYNKNADRIKIVPE